MSYLDHAPEDILVLVIINLDENSLNSFTTLFRIPNLRWKSLFIDIMNKMNLKLDCKILLDKFDYKKLYIISTSNWFTSTIEYDTRKRKSMYEKTMTEIFQSQGSNNFSIINHIIAYELFLDFQSRSDHSLCEYHTQTINHYQNNLDLALILSEILQSEINLRNIYLAIYPLKNIEILSKIYAKVNINVLIRTEAYCKFWK